MLIVADWGLVYLGESASLSYLDTIRRVVENTLGPSDFTRDSHKNKIVEGSISTSRRATYVLPDREAAEFLIDSFLSNVSLESFLSRERQIVTNYVDCWDDSYLRSRGIQQRSRSNLHKPAARGAIAPLDFKSRLCSRAAINEKLCSA